MNEQHSTEEIMAEMREKVKANKFHEPVSELAKDIKNEALKQSIEDKKSAIAKNEIVKK